MPSRTLQHLTDSKARYVVASLKPDEWEWREMTGRDYGIDMEWEPFENGTAQVAYFSFKSKGDGRISATASMLESTFR